MEPFKIFLGKLFSRLGFSANGLTILGLLLAAGTGFLAALGFWMGAGCLLLISGLVDMADGAVARHQNKATIFGGIFDSCLDRYGDGFVFGGAMFYFLSNGFHFYGILCLSAWIAAFSISYVRARVECEIDGCRVGFWERGERIVFLALSFLLCNPSAAILILAVALHATVYERIRFAYQATKQPTEATQVFLQKNRLNRSSLKYLTLAGMLVLSLILFRLPLSAASGSCQGACPISSRYEKINFFSALRKMGHTPCHPLAMERNKVRRENSTSPRP